LDSIGKRWMILEFVRVPACRLVFVWNVLELLPRAKNKRVEKTSVGTSVLREHLAEGFDCMQICLAHRPALPGAAQLVTPVASSPHSAAALDARVNKPVGGVVSDKKRFSPVSRNSVITSRRLAHNQQDFNSDEPLETRAALKQVPLRVQRLARRHLSERQAAQSIVVGVPVFTQAHAWSLSSGAGAHVCDRLWPSCGLRRAVQIS
jgi:hypothetical protein